MRVGGGPAWAERVPRVPPNSFMDAIGVQPIQRITYNNGASVMTMPFIRQIGVLTAPNDKMTAVIADADVANLYGVETKRINEAVRNNPDKFPEDYMFILSSEETAVLRSKFSSTKLSSKSRSLPKAFTEKGLYMLATILKSKNALNVTFAIIETFTKVRSLKRELQRY